MKVRRSAVEEAMENAVLYVGRTKSSVLSRAKGQGTGERRETGSRCPEALPRVRQAGPQAADGFQVSVGALLLLGVMS